MQRWSSKACPLSSSKQTRRPPNQKTLKDCLGEKKAQENLRQKENNELGSNKYARHWNTHEKYRGINTVTNETQEGS